MEAFYIVLICLWVYPPLAYFLFFLTKSKLPLRRQLVICAAYYSAFIIICMYLHIATTSFAFNVVFLFSLYLTVALLLMFGASRKNIIVRSLSYIAMVFIFIVGYISSTIGFLGVGFILAEYQPQKTLIVKSKVIYKEYGLGNAISDWGGTEVALYRPLLGIPFTEHRFFDKQYTGGNQSKVNNGFSSNVKGFYAHDINIGYNHLKDLLVVSDPSDMSNTDTIFLYKMK